MDVELLQDSEFAIRIDDELIATIIFACPGMDSRIFTQNGVMRPGPGAISTEYNRLQPSSSIILSGHVQLPFACQTIIKIIQPDSDRLN